MATRSRVSLGAALIIFIAGAGLAYWAITNSAADVDADLRARWQNLDLMHKLVVVVGFIASTWGLGATIDNLVRRMKEKE